PRADEAPDGAPPGSSRPSSRPPLRAPAPRTLPWRALQTLVQQGRRAADRGDQEELAKIEEELLDLVGRYDQKMGDEPWSSDSTSSPPPPATSPESPSTSTRDSPP